MKKMRCDVNKPIKFRRFYKNDWEERQVRKVGLDMQQQLQKHSYGARTSSLHVTAALDVPSASWTQSKRWRIFSASIRTRSRVFQNKYTLFPAFYCDFVIICRYSFSWLYYSIQGSSFIFHKSFFSQFVFSLCISQFPYLSCTHKFVISLFCYRGAIRLLFWLTVIVKSFIKMYQIKTEKSNACL
jgi:hypothetical protein